MRSLLLISALAIVSATASAQSVKVLTADKSNEYGLVYNLPVTCIEVDLTACFTEHVAGPYRQYAPRYLGNVSVIENDSRSCELTNVSITTSGIPGDEKYLMTLKPGATTSICVDADGMLLAINTDTDLPERKPIINNIPPARPQMDEYLQYVDEDFLVSLSDAKKAQMLARAIMEIRESRLSLSRGTAESMPTDGRQLELMLQSLQTQENALMRAFVGYEYTYTESRRITITPDASLLDGERSVIARLSPAERFAAGDDLVGEPIYLSISNVIAPEMPVNAKGEPKAMPKDAIVYCIPATATLQVTYKGRTLMQQNIQMSQGGEIFGLDPKLFTDKKAPSYATFDPATGAVIKIAQIGSNI